MSVLCIGVLMVVAARMGIGVIIVVSAAIIREGMTSFLIRNTTLFRREVLVVAKSLRSNHVVVPVQIQEILEFLLSIEIDDSDGSVRARLFSVNGILLGETEKLLPLAPLKW